MGKRMLVVAAALLAGLLLAGQALALDERRVLRLDAFETSSSFTDAAPRGPGGVDVGVFEDRLVNRRAQFGKPSGAVVGRDSGFVVVTGPRSAFITVTLFLPDGKLVLSSSVSNASRIQRGPVVGGTGEYANARGTIRAVPFGEGNAHLTIRLIPVG